MWSLVIIKFEIVLISPNEKEKKITYIIEKPRKPRRTIIIKGEFQIEIKFELLIRLQNEQHIETLLVFFVAVIIQCYSIL